LSILLDDETLAHTRLVADKHARRADAAMELGISERTLRQRLQEATARGIDPYIRGGKLPNGQLLKGVSTFFPATVDKPGQWVKTMFDRRQELTIEAIRDAFKEFDGKSKIIKPPVYLEQDLATFYIVSDHHLGLYAWKKETGNDYDVEIGKRVLRESMAELVSQTPKSETAVILNLGDFFHSDSNENRTRRSGNVLDVDTRFQLVLKAGVYLLIDVIEMAKSKHKKVLVRNNIGNHDPYGTLALAMALKTYYTNDPRVEVDDTPNPLWFWEFGKVLVGSTHGDMIKHTDMPAAMATHAHEAWGRTLHRYIYLGHVHHKSIGGGEKHGATWETFRTLAAKDAWHHQSGYASERSMVAITHHSGTGEKYRNTVTI
jgi:hypothetical protein